MHRAAELVERSVAASRDGKTGQALDLARAAKRAVEITRRRGRLEASLASMEARLQEARASGVDAHTFERNLANARAKLDCGEYGAAETLLRKTSIKTLDAKRERQVRSWINRAAKSIAHAKERGGDVSLADRELDEARQAAKIGDVASVRKAVDAAKRAAEGARKFARAETAWLRVNAEVEATRTLGVRPRESRRLLRESRAALKKGVYADVTKFAQLAKVALREEKRHHATESALKVATRELRKEKRRGSDTRRAARLLEDASKALASKEYPRVRTLSKDAVGELKVAGALRKVEDALASLSLDREDLQQIGADTTEFDLRLKDATKAMNARDLPAAKRFVRATRRTAGSAREARYRAIVQFTIERILRRAGEGRVDAAQARQLLSEVESALAGGQVVDVEALTKERLDPEDSRRLRELSERLVLVKEDLLELKRANIDVSGTEEKLVRVASLLSERRYDDADLMLHEIHEITKQLREAFRASAQELLSKARETVERVKAQRVPIPDAVRILRNAEDASERGRNYETIEFSRIAIDRAERTLAKHLAETAGEKGAMPTADEVRRMHRRLDDLREEIDALSGEGVNVTAARETLDRGRRPLDQGKFGQAEAYLNSATEIVRSLSVDLRRRAEEALESIGRTIERTKLESLSVPDLEAQLDAAEGALKSERYGTVLRTADTLRSSIDEARLARAQAEQRRTEDRAKEAAAQLARVRELVADLRPADIDIEGADEAIQAAERALEEQSVDLVDRLLGDLEDTARSLKSDLLRAARDLIERARIRIAVGEELNLDVNEENELLRSAEELLETGPFDLAVENARLAEQKADAAISAHQEANEAKDRAERERARATVTDVKKLVTDLGRADIEIVNSKEALAAAERALDEGRYDDVLTLLAEVRNMARSLGEGLERAAEDLIGTVRETVARAKAEGLEVPRADQVLGNADDAIRDSRYVEAIEYKKVIEDILETARRQQSYKDLVVRIQGFREEIQRDAALGGDLGTTSELLRRAEEDMALGRFEQLQEYAEEIAETIAQARKSSILSRLEAAKAKIQQGHELGLDMQEDERHLREATGAAEAEDWGPFNRLLDLIDTRAEDWSRTATVQRANEEIGSIEATIVHAGKLGMDVREIRAMLDEVRTAMEQGDYEDLEHRIAETRAALERDRSHHLTQTYETKLESVATTIGSAERTGADVTETRQIFEQARDALGQRDLGMADILVKQAQVSADIQIQNFIKNRYPHLVLKLPRTGLQANTWNRYVFEVLNQGKLGARNVDIQFGGEVDVKGDTSIPELREDERKVVEIGLMPRREGDVPVNVQVFYQRYFDENRYETADGARLRVERAGTYLVEDVFLVHSDGRLISHHGRKLREAVDEDIFTGMLTVVQDFVKDSFRSRTRVGLKRLDFGDSMVLIERSPHTFLASVVIGKEPKLLPVYMIEILKEVEERYGDRLEKWSGMLHEIEGIDEIIGRLIFVTTEKGADLGELERSTVTETARLLESVQEIGGDTEEVDALLSEAEASLERDLDTSWTFITQAKDKAEETKGQIRVRIKETLDATVHAVEELRGLGADVAHAEMLLREARKAFDSGDYPQVRETAKGIRESLDRAKEEIATRRVEEEMTKLFQEIEGAKARGVDVREADGYLTRIQDAVESKDYGKFGELVERALTSIRENQRRALTERTGEQIEEIRTMLGEARALGVEAPDAEESLKFAEEARESGRVDDLQSRVDRARIEARSAIEDHLKDRYPRLFIRLARPAVQAEAWNRFDVEVANKGNWAAQDVELGIRGDVDVQGLDVIEHLGPDERRTLEIGVRPRAPGTVPIDFEVFYRRPLDDARYEVTDSKEVQVEPAGTYRVREALLFHKDGRLIAHERRLPTGFAPPADRDRLQESIRIFLRDRYASPDVPALARFEEENLRLVAEHGPGDFLVAVLDGEEPPLLPLYLVEILSEIETVFGDRLGDWSGRSEDLAGIGELVRKILYATDREGADRGPLEGSALNEVFRLSEQGLLKGEGDVDFVSWARGIVETQDYSDAVELVQRVARTVEVPREQMSRAIREAVAAGRESGGLQVSDEMLQQYVDIVRDTLEAVFRAKKRAGIEKYWPVKRLAIKAHSQEVLDAVTSFRKVIVGQGHAKELDLVGPEDTWHGMHIELQVDMGAVSTAYRLWSKKIEILLKSQDSWKIKTALAKGAYNVGIEGQQVRIEPSMVSFQESIPETVIEEPFDEGVVYLDAEMTSEVLAEGYALEVVKIIKDIRRDLELADQASIRTKIRSSDDLTLMLREWRDYISRETNSLELDFVREPVRDGYVVEAQLGDEKFLVSVSTLEAQEDSSVSRA